LQYRCFSIGARGEPEAEEAFNRFLRSVRVLSVEREFVTDGPASFWSFCVAYLDSPKVAGRQGKPPRVDYREVLSAADFAVFARLREVRKTLAEAEAVPAYAVCTNEQLAAMATACPQSLSALRRIEGIGEAKAAKYGEHFLAVLREGRDDGEAGG